LRRRLRSPAAGVTDLNEGAVDLNAALRASIRIVHERAARKPLRIETDLAPSAPVIRGDERPIKQIILNLLSNCTKYADEGGTISVTSKVEVNGEILLIVAYL
jgi:signal transduction histidine kinase